MLKIQHFLVVMSGILNRKKYQISDNSRKIPGGIFPTPTGSGRITAFLCVFKDSPEGSEGAPLHRHKRNCGYRKKNNGYDTRCRVDVRDRR